MNLRVIMYTFLVHIPKTNSTFYRFLRSFIIIIIDVTIICFNSTDTKLIYLLYASKNTKPKIYFQKIAGYLFHLEINHNFKRF